MNKTPELKPCPFCGGEAKIKRVTGSINYRYVKCSSCGARTKEWFGVDVAVKTWDTRVYQPEVQAAIERDHPEPIIQHGHTGIVDNRCPKCLSHASGKFCSNCGQRLDWSNHES